ncbi:unnamed protein product [Adineta ricciae]|uniref:Uncharacterized protein n=1 Tax=Adineta ricciae TaxID=249248 RepID=A0A815SCP3_ADIRI|nr:unnamed protein product [Adineta ricciae]CAF1536553.1 unnamed protein product [Adineta ricciae]
MKIQCEHFSLLQKCELKFARVATDTISYNYGPSSAAIGPSSSPFRHSFRRFQQVLAGSLPPDSGRNCTENIRSVAGRFQLEVCRKRSGNDWNLRLNFRPEPTVS